MCKNTHHYFGVNFLKRHLKRNGGSTLYFFLREKHIHYMLFSYIQIKTLQNRKDKEEDSHMIHIKKELTMVKPLLSKKTRKF